MAEACMKDIQLLNLDTGSPLLELRFGVSGGGSGGTVMCRIASISENMLSNMTDFTSVLLIATRDFGGDGPATQPSQVTSTPRSMPTRRAQPQQGVKRRAVARQQPPLPQFNTFPNHGEIQKSLPTPRVISAPQIKHLDAMQGFAFLGRPSDRLSSAGPEMGQSSCQRSAQQTVQTRGLVPQKEQNLSQVSYVPPAVPPSRQVLQRCPVARVHAQQSLPQLQLPQLSQHSPPSQPAQKLHLSGAGQGTLGPSLSFAKTPIQKLAVHADYIDLNTPPCNRTKYQRGQPRVDGNPHSIHSQLIEAETVGALPAGVLGTDAIKPWDGRYTMISKPRFDEFRPPVKEFGMAGMPKHKIGREPFSCAEKSALHGAEGGDDTFSP